MAEARAGRSEAARGSQTSGRPVRRRLTDLHTVSGLRAHQLLATVSHRTRAHLIDAVTGELRDHPDWPTLRTTIIAWCDNGFNQVRTAEALHIHRGVRRQPSHPPDLPAAT